MDRIRAFFREKQWKKMRKDQWVILLLAGVLLLVVAIPTDCGSTKAERSGTSQKQSRQSEKYEDADAYVSALEKRLQTTLQQMDGVGKVEVMITLKDQGESVVEKDHTTSSENQEETSKTDDKTNRSQTETSEKTVYDSDSEEGTPFVSKKLAPEIDGVLVVAQGGADTVTAENISEAVQALFSVEPHKIKIVKMNAQEADR